MFAFHTHSCSENAMLARMGWVLILDELFLVDPVNNIVLNKYYYH